MNTLTLITKTPFYVRPLGADGEAKQEFVRLGSGAVLRHMGNVWCKGMSYHPPGTRLGYLVRVIEGTDDLNRSWAGKRVVVSPERFTGALVDVASSLSPELKSELTRVVTSLAR